MFCSSSIARHFRKALASDLVWVLKLRFWTSSFTLLHFYFLTCTDRITILASQDEQHECLSIFCSIQHRLSLNKWNHYYITTTSWATSDHFGNKAEVYNIIILNCYSYLTSLQCLLVGESETSSQYLFLLYWGAHCLCLAVDQRRVRSIREKQSDPQQLPFPV